MGELEQLAELLEEFLDAPLRGSTNLLVLQGTPFCNIDCAYCYLPDRDSRARMAPALVEQAASWLHRSGLAADELTIVWHAGEPLVLPIAWYEDAFARIASAMPGRAVRHAFQTNGLLIDEAWCAFFARHCVSVGVSIDGPARLHDARRRTRAGRGTHDGAMRAVRLLQRHGVRFHALAVVGEAALDDPDGFVDFFLDAGIEALGLNVEEIEGANRASSLAHPDVERRFRAFLARVTDRALASGRLRLREFWNMAERCLSESAANDEATPFAILTVTADGALSTYSPELAGGDGRFAIGRFDERGSAGLFDVIDRQRLLALAAQVHRGVRRCTSCAYFRLCGGGAPANKLAENGSFDSGETLFCRLTRQAAAEVALERLALVADLLDNSAEFKISKCN
ncbi:GRRM system radical SAM/SPASM domain protein [Alsobacter sp. SYSU M60028]|uniref:GRRM system radical SAM/SPASM domain protein n=1 Tax=Alsobacter ponti TaxID=2962936 RepID=A0ABT1LIP4_9HYPH|nr:cyclophane-forming radical SAM/SPASM peptide maturase GrrM/OscB [Alsobacter ponti]MCP8940821.1 GRRM system radical SAM/SPASM domain protein [Alsobacter ponti]